MSPASLEPYAAIGITMLMVVALTGIILVLAHTVGPKRRGPVKDSPYESGMPVVGDTHQRFNVRFYAVAILYLLFAVEVILMYPWAVAYFYVAGHNVPIALEGGGFAGKGFLLAGAGLFIALLVFGLLYEWKKGALEWN